MDIQIMIYKNYGRPFLKLFIGSLAVYSAIYYSWVGLEKGDMKRRGGGMILYFLPGEEMCYRAGC